MLNKGAFAFKIVLGALKWPLKGGSGLIQVAATAGLTVIVFILSDLISVCAYWMIFGGNKYTAASAGDPNRTELTILGFEGFGPTMWTLYRMTLVDEYPFEVSLISRKS